MNDRTQAPHLFEEAPAAQARKPKRKSPTARTLEEVRSKGWDAQVVEKWLPGRRAKKGGAPGETESTAFGKRKDLFGCIDILCLDGNPGSLGIQACAAGDAQKRATKAIEEPLLRKWLAAGNRFQVWGWREIWVDTSSRTKMKKWQPRVLAVRLMGADLQLFEVIS